MKRNISIKILAAILIVLGQYGFVILIKPAKGKLAINFKSYVGKEILTLDNLTYKNESGQPFTVTNFKYYVGNFHLKSASGKEFISNEYFLIKEDDDQSKQIILTDIPEGKYTSCSFILGVDSLHNCSGAQSGALDPANGMFWTWNTGYIFLKLEGKSPASISPGHIFEFHIGGYKSLSNCIRTVSLNTKNLLIETGKITSLELKVDANETMKTPTTIDLSKLSSVTDFHNATTIADNYKDMFTVLSIKNEK